MFIKEAGTLTQWQLTLLTKGWKPLTDDPHSYSPQTAYLYRRG